jgi:transcriptional regulator with XRE-family HTH domain
MGKGNSCSEYSAAFGDRLRTYRIENNYSQRQLGAMTNVNSTTISRIENGRTLPSSNFMYYLSKRTECNIDALVLGFEPQFAGGEFLELFIQNIKLPENIHRTAMYAVRLAQIMLDTDEAKCRLSSENYHEYMFNIKLAERICEKYHNNAEEGQVFSSIREVCGMTKKEMSGLLELKEGRYGYLESHGHPTVTELVKLYNKLKINPAFVLSGRCEELVIIREIHRMQVEGV